MEAKGAKVQPEMGLPGGVAQTDADLSVNIPSLLKRCGELAKFLLSTSTLDEFEDEVSKDSWRDEYARLQMWAANIGAYATGDASIAVRLRNRHMSSVILRTRYVVWAPAWADIQYHVSTRHFRTKSSYASDSNSDSDSTTFLQELYSNLDAGVTALLKSSVAIRNSARHERLILYDKHKVDAITPFFAQFVEAKFPEASRTLSSRLGRAIARRRAEIEYRQKQSARRKFRVAELFGESNELGEGSQASTKLTDYAGHVIPDFDETRTQATVQTTYTDLKTPEVDDPLEIPQPPKESARGSPFECPYCFQVTQVNSLDEWRNHVLHDSLPYLCVVDDCVSGDTLYRSRREFLKHLQQMHHGLVNARDSQSCFLCGTISVSNLALHLSQHLIQLALYSIAPFSVDSDVNEGSEDQHVAGESLHSHTHPGLDRDADDGFGYSRPIIDDSLVNSTADQRSPFARGKDDTISFPSYTGPVPDIAISDSPIYRTSDHFLEPTSPAASVMSNMSFEPKSIPGGSVLPEELLANIPNLNRDFREDPKVTRQDIAEGTIDGMEKLPAGSNSLNSWEDDPTEASIDEVDRSGQSSNIGYQVTSYWSVPEQQKFPQLVGYYGRDFQAIADFMKTKTVTMIKIYWNRQIADGKSDLEEVASLAEQRRMEGDDIGPPPSPAARVRHRYR